jgi:hypothetical protein
MFQPQAAIIADSVNLTGDRLTTFVLTDHRMIHSEFMTHRMLSKNSSHCYFLCWDLAATGSGLEVGYRLPVAGWAGDVRPGGCFSQIFFFESRILTCLTYTSRRGSQHRGQTAEQEDTKARKAKLQRPRTAAQGSLSHKQQA